MAAEGALPLATCARPQLTRSRLSVAPGWGGAMAAAVLQTLRSLSQSVAGVPPGNVYGLEQYRLRLARAGFCVRRFDIISQRVYDGTVAAASRVAAAPSCRPVSAPVAAVVVYLVLLSRW